MSNHLDTKADQERKGDETWQAKLGGLNREQATAQ